MCLPVTVPVAVRDSQEDEQEDQQEEDGSEHAVHHRRGDGDAHGAQTPHVLLCSCRPLEHWDY